MKLSALLSAIDRMLPSGVRDTDIRTLTQNAREAVAGSLFVCIQGARFDGHDFAKAAYDTGCRCFVSLLDLALPSDALCVVVTNTRRALSLLAAAFFGYPSRRLRLIGITGTKGKTTTALMLRAILEQAGHPTGYIGTNGILFGSHHSPSLNTTPDALTLQHTLSDMCAAGMETVLLEVSSQALMQERVVGCDFDTLLFTNLYTDHVGPNEHASFEDYRAAKHLLFTEFPARLALFNADAPASSEMQRNARASRLRFVSRTHAADAVAEQEAPHRMEHALGISFVYRDRCGAIPVQIPLIGSQNVENALLAMACAVEGFGVSHGTAARALQNLQIEGRSELIPLENRALALIDYAHNGESLERLLIALRAYAPSRLSVLFGSVGERTALRRRELGEVAARYSDRAILTSDNPGTEDPERIIDEIAAAFSGTDTPYVRFADRRQAIFYAIGDLLPGEILVLAGKGHEKYQLIGNQKIYFCERELVLDALRQKASLPKA